MNETKNLIKLILEENGELAGYQITKKLKEKGRKVSWETVWRNVKYMTEEGILIRERKGKPNMYYYKLNKKYNN